MSRSSRGSGSGPEVAQAARELYDRISPDYLRYSGATLQAGLLDTWRPDPAVASNAWLGQRAGITDGLAILDLGGGVGGPAVQFAASWPACRVDLVTISPVQASIAEERAQAAGVAERVVVHCRDYHDLPFASGSFDLVYFLESSGYAYDPERLFGEVWRVLRPGGRLYIKDLFLREPPWSDAELEQIEAVNRLWAQARVPTLAEWSAQLGAAGFIDVAQAVLPELNTYHFWGAMFDASLQLNPLGREFFRDFPAIDLMFFGEVKARRPD